MTKKYTDEDVIARFARTTMQRVNGCLEWMGALNTGYGSLAFRGRVRNAHVVAYVLANGEPPAGSLIRHLCHNRLCVNPSHLEHGTHKDNRNDSKIANRLPVGEANGNSKLTTQIVKDIKELLAAGVQGTDIAARFSVGAQSIYAIKNGKTWRHV